MTAAQPSTSFQVDPIEFIDLKAQQKRIRHKIDARIQTVLNHGAYIMGPEVAELEHALSRFCGAQHTISCSNGTDALGMVLMAQNVGVGDAVFVPSFTFAATAEVVAWEGATPVFIDSDPMTFNMCPKSLRQGIARAMELGLTPKAVISVDLFGLPADYDALLPVCEEYNLWLLDDAAQGFGAKYKGRSLGTFGLATTTSFFPAKPLGCYGDGGAIFTDCDDLAQRLKSIRVHGQGDDKYDNKRIGINGRFDTLQAAVLLEKLAIFQEEIEARNRIAKTYNDALSAYVTVPVILDDCVSTWAQYTVVLPKHVKRDQVMSDLKQMGIPTAVYYPRPLHQQGAYAEYPTASQHLPVCEELSQHVLSLPMHPYVTAEQQEYIIQGVRSALS